MLERDGVGRNDDFFHLGGHSLLAARVVSRVRRLFAVELPVRALFEAPTLERLAAEIERLRIAASGEAPPPLTREPREGAPPLSFAQQRLWFLDQLEPGPAYNIPTALDLEAGLDVPALARALTEIVRRHEALRTVFAAPAGEPVQVIRPAEAVELPVVDLAGLAADARRVEARRLAAGEWLRPFDLARGPLLRAGLLRLGGEGNVLLATMHHIVSDAWSVDVLGRELASLYAAFRQGLPSPLPELPVQYADFAIWQRRWLAGEALDRQLAYWRRRLAGAPPVLEIPTDRPRSLARGAGGASRAALLSAEVSAALRSLARRQGATLFMTLLGGFAALLSRYSAREDLCLGTPVAGRRLLETEGLVGLFVNTLVLRIDLSGGAGLASLVHRTREAVLAAHAHQDLPFEKLVEELRPERSLDHAPLFQVMFDLAHLPPGAGLPGSGGLAADLLASLRPAAKFDLSLSMVDGGGPLAGTFEHSAGLFDGTTVERMLAHLRCLLEAAVAAPERPFAELPLLSGGERAQLLAEWNDTAPATAPAGCVHELIAAQASRSPDAIAVELAGAVLTCRELDLWAAGVARGLRRLGVGPESRVGLHLERSLEMVAALLGVLKAGGAYVPVDPALPAARRRALLADAKVAAVVTGAAGLAGLSDLAVPVLAVEGLAAAGGARESFALPASPAYVIYTSGSTGRPKGVVVPHRALANYATAAAAGFQLGPEDRVLQFASLSFDASAEEIFPCLLAGATLVLRPEGMLDSIPGFLAACGDLQLTVLDLPTAFWREVVKALDGGDLQLPSTVRLVIIGGEQALAGDLALWRRSVGGRVRLGNTYGPTEATVVATSSELSQGPARAPHLVPIGRPVPGARVHVLDGRLDPVPIGVPGELCIGGAGVARGYLDRPDATAERFVPDPFAAGREAGARLYRTGDLARRLADGEIEFLGRADHQVKIRGFRIELGEVEAALRGMPEVSEAAVAAIEESPGEKRLVAFVAAPGGPDAAAGLRERLRRLLPEPMVPSVFVILPSLPLTAGGKVDRRALAQLRPAAGDGGSAVGLPPRTPLEELLAGVWAEVLGREGVGVDESFFDLGGHSLLATQVVSRVREALGIELSLRTLFEAPTVASLARWVAEAQGGPGPAELPPLGPVDRRGGSPLSFSQERLWFIDQLEPGGGAYNIPSAVRLSGSLAVPALAACLSEIARRHEVLRTRFIAVEGGPRQVVAAPAPVALPVVDLAALPPRRRAAEARILLAAEAARPFDLARGPVARALLVRLGEAEHDLAVTLHHIVSDGWSMGVLVGELSALYRAFLAGRPSPLPELAVQYGDFAVWQRGWLAGEVLERELAYWRRKLVGAPHALELGDRPRPAVHGRRGGWLAVSFPPSLAAALRRVTRRGGGTLFMGLLAGFQALLARYSGQDDLLVGSPVANRTRVDLEKLIGFFVNTLVLRGELGGDPSFGALLAQVRETALGAYAHQDLPFERLVEELAPERDLSRPPLVQAMLVLENTPLHALELPGLRLEPLGVAGGAAKLDLTLTLGEAGGGLAGTLAYSPDLFDPSTTLRLMGHLEALLAAAVADPGRPLSQAPLLVEAERHQLFREWNDTAAPGLGEGLLHELFAAQVARAPEAVALISAAGELTYGELARRVDGLAGRLAALGVGPEAAVAVCVERSPEMVVAALAVLAAGGAYVPLDPGYPADRLAFLLADSGARWVLTQESLLGALPPTPAEVLCLDRPEAGDGSAAPRRRPSPDGMAYLIYTSGSTGRPKGVVSTHRGGSNRLLWGQIAYPLGPGDRVLQTASFSFDFAAWEIFAPLAFGAAVVLPEPGAQRDPARLAAVIAEHRITTAHFVPSLLAAFLDETDAARCGSLRYVFCGGEALAGELRDRFFARMGSGARLFNQYGPTEASIDVTFHPCAPGETGASVPIGRAIANTALHVLDPGLYPLPAGVPGELCAGGEGLARGYLGRPDLTAEKFVPDPWGAAPGGRLYRTGDLARRLPDGRLDFLGRIDQQVKIRGFRIELGEIEAVLAGHPAVREAAVAVQEGTAGGHRLIACVVPAAGEAGLAPRLRAHLDGRLPAHMVPAVFAEIEALPRTPSGKLDRRALARLAPVPAATGGLAIPRTPFEELLAGVFAEVLQLDGREPGPEDDFFSLGGHSLLATRLVSQVRAAFGVELPLRDVFEHPGLPSLARRIEERLGAADATPVPPILRVPRGRELPLSFAQERLWFLDQLAPGSTAYSVPAQIELAGRLDPALLAGSLGEIVRRHEVLRTTFSVVEGKPVQVIAPAGPLRLPLVDLSALRESAAEVRRLAAEEAARPFDLAQGPLFRLALLRLDADRHHLVYTLHHVVGDGWSTGVIVRELGALYRSLAAGRPAELPELPVQYADYAVWQRAWVSGQVLARLLAYWRRRLAGEPPALRLPLEAPPAGTAPGGAREVLPLAPDLGTALAELARREGSTLFMALLAGFQVLLHRSTGETDIAVGTAVAGRDRAEIEGLVGFFVNMLVLRTDLSGSPRFRDVLGRVREVAMGAYAHQDLPFEKLVEELGESRDRSLFQIAFGLQNAHSESLELPGLEIRSVEHGEVVPRFDLTVWVLQGEAGLEVSWTYRTDIFPASAIAQLHGRYERLLRSAVERPDERIHLLEMLTESERLSREAEERERERRQVDKLFNVRRRGVNLPPVEASTERTPEKGADG